VTDNSGATANATATATIVNTSTARLDPKNQTGGNGENPLSRNYNWSVTLVDLPGRAGLDLGLSLSYNSLVWTRNGSSISFNDDGGFPSPGFRLGFPVIQSSYFNSLTQKNALLLITANGERVELRQVNASNIYEAADSSYLVLEVNTDNTLTLRTTDGTQLSFELKGSDYKCTKVKDRNGNFISINYVSNRIDTVVDTLARTIKFNYDTDGYLNSITQVRNQGTPTELTYEWASFTYNPALPVATSLVSDVTNAGPQNGSTLKVLTSVKLNNNTSRFDFDYTPWVQVWKISNFATDGHLLNYRAYNLPGSQLLANSPQNDCPRFTERHDWAENWNRSGSPGPSGLPGDAELEAITTYSITLDASWTLPDGTTTETGTVAQVTQPDGTYNKFYFGVTAGPENGWKRGLPSMVETYGRTIPGQGSPIKQRSLVNSWAQDVNNVSYQVNPRILERNIYDFNANGQIQNRTRSSVVYQTANFADGTSCKLPQDVFEYRENGTTVLRRTHTAYNLTTTYTNRHIIGLATEKSVYEVDPDTQTEMLVSKISLAYDESGSIQGTDAPVQHDNTNYGASLIAGRGNLTSMKRHNVADVSQFTASSMTYNTTGAVVTTVDPAGHQVQLSYSDQFSANGTTLDASRPSTLAYPTTITDPDGYISSVRYHYDFGAETWKQTPQPNTVSNLPGPQQTFIYDSIGRLQRINNLVNGAYTRYVYPGSQSGSQNRVDTYTTIIDGANEQNGNEAHSFKLFDGHGRIIASASSHPGSTGGFSGQLLLYDNMGRLISSSNPTETEASGTPSQWTAVGDDAQAGWLYTRQSYDWKGRPLVTTNTDNTSKAASYNGCGCAGGEVVTLTDEVGRRQKIYSDVLGRRVKTELLNWDSSVYSTTVNTYNGRDQLTQVRRYQGTDQSTVFKQTTLSYDGYGRLKTKHDPEQQVDPNNAASTDHTTWDYNPDDTIHQVTDARGASVTYSYNNRRLVNGITYNAPIVSSPGSPIPVPPPVAFDYDAAGNRLWMNENNQRKVTYHYDALSQMDWEERHLPGLPGAYRLSYEYDLAGGVKKVSDETAGTSFSTVYDNAGRVSAVNTVTFNGGTLAFASQIQHRASGAVKSIAYGNNTSLTLGYNARGLLASYAINGAIIQWFVPPQPATLMASYQYHADGKIKFVQDQAGSNNIRDRAYSYDHVGRLAVAFSGGEARDFANGTSTGVSDGPYRHNYTYDVWDNRIAETGRYWSRDVTSSVNYNELNRNLDWSYDGEGNLISRNEQPVPENAPHYSYDAAGRDAGVTYKEDCIIEPQGIFQFNVYTKTNIYDGDGQLVSFVQTRTVNGTMAAGWPTIVNHLRSTVLGGRVISDYDGQGNWGTTMVYVGNERIGTLGKDAPENGGGPFYTWRYNDPLTGDEVTTMKNNNFSSFSSQSTLDSNGVNVPLSDPFPPPGEEGEGTCVIWDGSFEGDGKNAQLFPMEDSAGCVLDGIPMNCAFISSEAAEQCPNNDCGVHSMTVTGRTRDGRIVASSTFLVRPGELGWDGSLDGTYRANPTFLGDFDFNNPDDARDFVANPELRWMRVSGGWDGAQQQRSMQRQGYNGQQNGFEWTVAEKEKLTSAVDLALMLLQSRPECAELLGSSTNAYEVLKGMKNSNVAFRNYSQSRPIKDGWETIAWTRMVNGIPGTFPQVDLYAGFFDDRREFDLNFKQTRALTILHELGHVNWEYFHSRAAKLLGSKDLSDDQVDQAIYDRCFRVPLPRNVMD